MLQMQRNISVQYDLSINYLNHPLGLTLSTPSLVVIYSLVLDHIDPQSSCHLLSIKIALDYV